MSDQRRTSERHVIVGLSRSEYEQRLVFGPPVGGREPRQHRHPDLGVTHAHGSEPESRAPHTHATKRTVDVDSYIPLDHEDADAVRADGFERLADDLDRAIDQPTGEADA